MARSAFLTCEHMQPVGIHLTEERILDLDRLGSF